MGLFPQCGKILRIRRFQQPLQAGLNVIDVQRHQLPGFVGAEAFG